MFIAVKASAEADTAKLVDIEKNNLDKVKTLIYDKYDEEMLEAETWLEQSFFLDL